MATTQRAWNKNWTLFRCSDAYAFFRGQKTFDCTCWPLIWQQKFKLSTILQNYIRAYLIWQRYLSWLVSHQVLSLIFADTDSISTIGWQSDQYVAFSCLSLVYFGLEEDFDNIIVRTNAKTFWQIFVVWFLLILSLFLEYVCNLELVDDYVRLFLLLCLLWDVNKKVTKNSSAKKGKGEVNQLSSKTLQTISICSTWSPWLKGLVLSETCGMENGKNSSSMLRWR